jgi:deferrochelatase/peroxidase EfeB
MGHIKLTRGGRLAGQDDRTGERGVGRNSSGRTRREVIRGAALVGVGVGLDHVLAKPSLGTRVAHPAGEPSVEVVPFFAPHQAGIATPAQDCLHFAAFDMTSGAVDDLRSLLEQWTAAAARLTAGESYQPVPPALEEPPVDTGEALGLGAARLTLTFGFGPSVFGGTDGSRFGLGRMRSPELAVLPPFQGEALDPSSSGGDLCVQACADDPQVAFHAIHVLSRIAGSVAALRYTQQGFGRTSSTSRSQGTPRNLMGFKDGTDDIRAEEAGAMDRFVWVQPGDGPKWMVGGSYLIARRIKILFDVWDATTLEDQERVIGRDKLTGAPLGGRSEYDPVDLQATGPDGELLIPADAHIRLASPVNNGGQRILRRGYSYSEAMEPGSGQIDAGLFFIAFQRSPALQFIPLQRRLSASDALSRHTLHTSSAIFACPPGPRPGGFVGEELFA